MPYDSPIAAPTEPTQAVAVYCSDGRFADHVRDFLDHRLGLTRVDAVTAAGGPVRLLEPDAEANLFEDVKFLLKAHDLRRIVLVQHDDCGHYTHRLGLEGAAAHARQIEHLHAAARRLRESTSVERIDLYFLHLTDTGVRFEPVREATDSPADP
jgi:carbonic anhydrase